MCLLTDWELAALYEVQHELTLFFLVFFPHCLWTELPDGILTCLLPAILLSLFNLLPFTVLLCLHSFWCVAWLC